MSRSQLAKVCALLCTVFVYCIICGAVPVAAASDFSVMNLKVEYTKTPLGLDVKTPRFSWQMRAEKGRGASQTAYQIVVKDAGNNVVWDTKKVESDGSIGIVYAGQPLKPSTKYTWTVHVWNQDKIMAAETYWFETGLMNADPGLAAWGGASWIGGEDKDQILYSQALSVFGVKYTLQLEGDSKKAGFVLGANDPRLMDKDKNMYHIACERDRSYIKFELDISGVDGTDTGLGRINIYRVGYKPGDTEKTPIKTFTIPLGLLNESNKYNSHDIYLWCNYGLFKIGIDGANNENVITPPGMYWNEGYSVNPVGEGGDYISFPMLADIGFSMDAGQKASFSNLKITNYRTPANPLFEEDLGKTGAAYEGIFKRFVNSNFKVEDGAYKLEGDSNGTLVLADPSHNSMPMLRTEFTTENKKIKDARLYVTARGIYEIYINGQRVGQDYFNPGLTQYNVTHMYQTYDVTGLVCGGADNVMGALLGEGWWSGSISFIGTNWNYFGDRQSLLAKLVITYKDGSTKVITTNPQEWKYYNNGPVVYGSLFQGEVYDATKEQAIVGWDKPKYDDRGWKQAVAIPVNEHTAYLGDWKHWVTGMVTNLNYNNMSLVGQIGPNATAVATFTAKSVTEVRPGGFVYDMGQNMVGIPKISINNGTRGQKITIRYAEMLYPNDQNSGDNAGMIMLENIRGALAQDTYVLKGGNEIIQPHFTYHGFRYIEITGTPKALPLESVQGIVISSVESLSSEYKSSNAKVNKLWENISWSLRGNFLSIPTDCPQRNERMGWSGDLSVFSRTAGYLTDSDQFLARHLYAMRDTQDANGRFSDIAPVGQGFGGVLWGSAGMTVPWEVYQQYGDTGVLQQNYAAMKKYIAYLDTRIDGDTGLLKEEFVGLGDWLSPEYAKTETQFLWSAYHVYDLWIMAQTADILGQKEEACLFWDKYEKRKAFFNRKFVDVNTHKTRKSDEKTLIDTQASYAVPLALGVFDAENARFAAEHLAQACRRENKDDSGATRPAYSLMTGFIGTAWISKALSDYGYNDVAYRLLQQTSYPSWLYPVEQGATTIWERLNSYTKDKGFGGNNSMNSFNHYSFGAVGSWLYNYSLGIQRDESQPGFKQFVLQPTPDPDRVMTWAEGYYDSVYGRIKSSWRIDGNRLIYKATVPANTTATLYLPGISADSVTEGGKPGTESKGIRFIKLEDGKVVYALEAGSYTFISVLAEEKKN